jgi:hypothetical protein
VFRTNSGTRQGSVDNAYRLEAANARNDANVKIVNRQWNVIRENLQRRAVHNKVAVNESYEFSRADIRRLGEDRQVRASDLIPRITR